MKALPIDQIDDRALVTSLRSDLCPACGGTKKPAQTLCRLCYIALPRRKRLALYDRLGEGYQEAVTAALDELGKAEFIVPPT